MVRNVSVAVYTVQQFFHVLAKLQSDTCRNLLNLTKCELDDFDFCLRIRMPRLWRTNPSCKTARNCVELHNMNLQRNWGGRTLAVKAEQKCVHIFGNEGRSEKWNYRSFAIKAEGKCGGGTSHIWQWKQSVSGEAETRNILRLKVPKFRFRIQNSVWLGALKWHNSASAQGKCCGFEVKFSTTWSFAVPVPYKSFDFKSRCSASAQRIFCDLKFRSFASAQGIYYVSKFSSSAFTNRRIYDLKFRNFAQYTVTWISAVPLTQEKTSFEIPNFCLCTRT